jgi:serine O-acetyltransferase
MGFWDLVRADLYANTGKRRIRRAIGAFFLMPSVRTLFRQRLAMQLVGTKAGRLAPVIWIANVERSGCQFHLDSVIGPGLRLPHPTAIVIGQGVRIGANVTLYQSVTIGRSRPEAYPVVEDDVTIYPNSVVIGGITIGKGAVIGAGSVVRDDVPAGAVVAGNPARLIRPAMPPA